MFCAYEGRSAKYACMNQLEQRDSTVPIFAKSMNTGISGIMSHDVPRIT